MGGAGRGSANLFCAGLMVRHLIAVKGCCEHLLDPFDVVDCATRRRQYTHHSYLYVMGHHTHKHSNYLFIYIYMYMYILLEREREIESLIEVYNLIFNWESTK